MKQKRTWVRTLVAGACAAVLAATVMPAVGQDDEAFPLDEGALVLGAAPEARTWTSRIDYFNPGTATVNFGVDYRQGGGSAAPSATVPVAAKASGSQLLSGTVPAGFLGSGVVSSDAPLAVLFRRQGTGASATAPMLTTPFTATDAGTGRFFLPEVRRGPTGNTLVGVQSLAGTDVTLSLDFISATGALKKTLTVASLKPLATAMVDLAKVASLGAVFDGSLVVRAKNVVGGAAAPVVASLETYAATGRQAYALAGSNGASNVVLAPRAMCLPGAGKTLSSLFQAQNAGSGSAKFVATYYYPVTAGGKTSVLKATATSALVPAGKRVSINPCAVPALAGKKGVVAVIAGRTAGGQPSPVAVAARWVDSVAGTENAYVSARQPVAGADGAYRVVFPAVEWGTTGTRTSIDIMNAAPKAAAAAAGVTVNVSFYSRAGALVKTKTLRVYTAATVDPSTAGALVGGKFAGAVIAQSASPIVGAAQVQQVGYNVADGYLGLPW